MMAPSKLFLSQWKLFAETYNEPAQATESLTILSRD